MTINSSFGIINKWISLLLHTLFRFGGRRKNSTFMEKFKFICCQQVSLAKYMESNSLFRLEQR